MKVTFTVEITLVLEDDDSAEEFGHDIQASIEREWIKFPEHGEAATVHIRKIDAE